MTTLERWLAHLLASRCLAPPTPPWVSCIEQNIRPAIAGTRRHQGCQRGSRADTLDTPWVLPALQVLYNIG